jgi:hypothetical protein
MMDAASLKSIAGFVSLCIVGIVLVYISRALLKHGEEWKLDIWWRKFVSGPSGYQRAIVILLGSVLIYVGVVGIVITIIS